MFKIGGKPDYRPKKLFSNKIEKAETEADKIINEINKLHHMAHGGDVEEIPNSIWGRIYKMVNDFGWELCKKLFPFFFNWTLNDFKEEVKRRHHHSYGIGGDIANMLDEYLGYETTRFKNFLKAHGEEKITKLEVAKAPIQKTVNLAFDILAGGKFEEAKKKLGIDNFFHISLIINNKYRIEKNETVNFREYKPETNEEKINVNVSKDININEFVANGAKANPKAFWIDYNAITANCGQWVNKLLNANGMNSDTIHSFLSQNTEGLLKELPDYVPEASKKITDVASYINRILQATTGGRLGFARGSRDMRLKQGSRKFSSIIH
jgi:hypothetical protein